MKPVIIYSMARSRSTAALQACVRSTQLNEPFDLFTLAGDNFTSVIETRTEVLRTTDWAALVQQMSDPDSVSKFFGTSLLHFPPAQRWFSYVDTQNTHDIFVLLRSPKEIIWSLVLATRFGFHSLAETTADNITVTEVDLLKADAAIDAFLRFYPANARTITFDNLPTEYFDYSKIMHREQHSLTKRNFVQNVEEVDNKIQLLLEFRQDQWYEKTKTNIFF